ncbi:rhamnogalacturonan acetylesterase [Trichophaea hybrida]|nr:rhamnogalacturonan acetylesterase [Trichophaea hybrida]
MTPLFDIRFLFAGFILQLVFIAHGAPSANSASIYLCSDSTAATFDPATSPLQGFGTYLGDYFALPFHNYARGGRSTRLYINQGLWALLLSKLVPGDYVIIEMGHNDNGTPGTGTDVGKDRAVLPGIGDQTIVVSNTTGGTGQETVNTFGYYLREMIKDVQAKNAIPILSGMVPTMRWNGDVLNTQWPFTNWTRDTALSEGVGFVDHTIYSVERFQALGKVESLTMFPLDMTHTDAKGAVLNAETFVTAVKCSQSLAVKGLVLNNKGATVNGSC